MARSRLPAWAYVLIAVVVAALLALLIWALIPKPSAVSSQGTPSPTPSSSSSATPSATPTPVASSTPAPTPTATTGSAVHQVTGGSNSGSTTPPVTTPPDTTPPGPVTDLNGSLTPRSVVLSWTNPADSDFTAVLVRRAAGSTAPASATSGTAVATVVKPGETATDGGLTPGDTYSYSVFARDKSGNISIAAVATFTLPLPLVFGTVDTSGAVTQVLPAGQTLSANGTLDFTAFDPSGTRTATATAVGASPLGSMTATVTEPVGATPGSVNWNYTVDNELVRHLGAGQSVSQQFTVTLSDGTNSINQTVTIEIDGINDPPAVANTLTDQKFTAGDAVSYSVPSSTFSDPDGDTLTYSSPDAPAWLSINQTTGALSGTPQTSDEGSGQLTIVATDPSGATASTPLAFTVYAPVETTADSLPWDLRYDNTSASVNVLSNDTGGVAPLTAVPVTNGTWTLDGQSTVAGSYTLTADGTLTLTPSSDNFGPLPKLHPGEIGTATLAYQATDGVTAPVTGTVSVTITGRLDPVYVVSPTWGPDGQELDFNDPTPTVFDASTVFSSPDPFYCENQYTLQNCDGSDTDYFAYNWAATSTGTVPPDPAFFNQANVPSVSALNQAWGFGASCTVQVTASPYDSRPKATSTISFEVGDTSG